jgi:hypothetical protein
MPALLGALDLPDPPRSYCWVLAFTQPASASVRVPARPGERTCTVKSCRWFVERAAHFVTPTRHGLSDRTRAERHSRSSTATTGAWSLRPQVCPSIVRQDLTRSVGLVKT